MPDFNNLINGLLAGMPDLGDAFTRGAQYAFGAFILVGIIYILRRYL
jgi:hypothetical protein